MYQRFEPPLDASQSDSLGFLQCPSASRAAKSQRIYDLIKLRAGVPLEAHGSTAINL